MAENFSENIVNDLTCKNLTEFIYEVQFITNADC